LPASTARYLVSGPTIIDKRMFAEVDRYASNTRAGSSAIYSGPVTGDTLRPVPGLSVKGGETYGAISSSGVLQIAFGHDYSAGRYWYSRDGLHFTPGPLPCPASTAATTGGAPRASSSRCATASQAAQGRARTATRSGPHRARAVPITRQPRCSTRRTTTGSRSPRARTW
jgi:hypothetical protein